MKEIKLDPKLKYDEALEQLQEIVRLLERKEITIDELASKVKMAKLLVDFCREKLDATEEEINKIIRPESSDEAEPF
ncbi:exodeoxyribonuclease VII small subunit [Crocinitomix algicola]|uniref:exodeoxyribonuclease VII small subunit n=1 Tax=Crocinitomix algicola TaxID=1740263 RepID=UPI00082BA3E5|nr:exodeoxyribonuclease VII small subunit [Crocinitomix algicola]